VIDEHRRSRRGARLVVTEEAFQQRITVAVFDVLLAHGSAPYIEE
jgi:hypothetical protein